MYLSASECRSELFLWEGSLIQKSFFLSACLFVSLGDVVALVCHISLLCGKWTEFMCPSFKGGFRLFIVLGISTLLTKPIPHGDPPWRLRL